MESTTNHGTQPNPMPTDASDDFTQTGNAHSPRHASPQHGERKQARTFCDDLLAVSQWMAEHNSGDTHPFQLHAPEHCPPSVVQAMSQLNTLTFHDVLNCADGTTGTAGDTAAATDDEAATDDTTADDDTANENATATAAANTANEFTPIESAPPSLAESLTMLLFSFDEREYAIATQRLMAEQPSTLDEIGKEFNITRERVRQIEKALRNEITTLLDGEFHLSERLAAMFEAEGPILRYATAARIIPELESTVEPEGLAILPLIGNLCSPTFSVSDGWLATPSIDDAVKLVKTDLPQAADEYDVVDLAPSASHANAEQHERETRNFTDWLAYSDVMLYKNHAILGRTQGDRAAAVLSVEQHPLTTEEIAERINAGNARSLANRLAVDERIMRVDIGTWALREWGLEEYSGIRQEIRERIERNGGSVRLDALVEELSSQFSISSRSVMTYAASLPFVSSNGVVTIAGAERFDVPD